MIIEEGNPLLTAENEKITIAELKKGNLKNILIEARKFVANDENGALGIALPQLGINKKAFIAKVRIGDDWITEIFVNPIVVPIGTEKEVDPDGEGCLSIPGKRYLVERYKKIKVIYSGIDGKTKPAMILKGLSAVIIQHEIDHTKKIIISQNGTLIEEEMVS